MRDAAGPRPLALAGVALVALLAVLAIGRQLDPASRDPGVILPEGGGWQVATAARLGVGVVPAGCGLRVAPDTLAVSHPALPCGIRVVIDVDGSRASVQVAGRAAAPGGAAFGLTPALARALRVGQPRLVRWALGAGWRSSSAPRAAFRLLWDYLDVGRPIVADHVVGLRESLKVLNALQTSGRIEATRLGDATGFTRLFQSVWTQVAEAEAQMADFTAVAANAEKVTPREAEKLRSELRPTAEHSGDLHARAAWCGRREAAGQAHRRRVAGGGSPSRG